MFLPKDRIDGITIQARQFQEAGHFDADNIRKKQEALLVRYEALREPMAMRKQKLSDSLRLQQLFRDVEDEETWIREKEPIAASTNRGETPPAPSPTFTAARQPAEATSLISLGYSRRQRSDRCPEPPEEAPGPAGRNRGSRAPDQGCHPERRSNGGRRYRCPPSPLCIQGSGGWAGVGLVGCWWHLLSAALLRTLCRRGRESEAD